ncbi:MAG: hypothetical protein LKF96_10880 [Treponema sp.]|jgi:hypothetical protein|nr:hypothetical protein [Treponema sp.]
MNFSQKTISKKKRCMLKGKLRQRGFDKWRFFCNGRSQTTGEERLFFLELYLLNPGISPGIPCFEFKKNSSVSAAELQNALTGSGAPDAIKDTPRAVSSYGAVRAGILGQNGKTVVNFFPAEAFNPLYKSFDFTVGPCSFSNGGLKGGVTLSSEENLLHPEYFCDSGMISWNLLYEQLIGFTKGFSGKKQQWFPDGCKTVFRGSFSVDDELYTVVPDKSFGYMDRSWGGSYDPSWFHISAAEMTSIITGRKLKNSCFAVQGCYTNRLSVVSMLEDRSFVFNAGVKSHKYFVTWECTQIPEDTDEEKLHWSVSVHDRNTVIDIDLFSKTDELCMGMYEIPSGGRLLQVLRSGSADGEIRYYNKIKKNLELIEHAHISNAVCEFGAMEKPGK